TFVDGIMLTQVSIDTTQSGTHIISYVATDQAGNTATSTRTVIVSASQVMPPPNQSVSTTTE
ncbi:DUF5011 domain-containing protein, partial [Candidatus Parcubacteria bacterium]|nr:DUF5011 domain-containing protein [Candidatus Parcubacteria bacterium]